MAVTPDTPFSRRPLRLATAAFSVLVFSGLGLIAASPASAAEVPCAGDACDDGAWASARGAANEISYWGMYAGHNCTNYVAWRLISAGVERPSVHPGAAADWAANAQAAGYLVDDVPSVGAVAQWEAFAGGYGEKGHVAYVERVNDDGTILVSEDYWGGGSQVGPLTYRVLDPATVSHFIHYLEPTDWLRTASLTDSAWVSSMTGLDIEPDAMTAFAGPSGTAELFYTQDGMLRRASDGSTGWTIASTGVRSSATTLSVVTMDGVRPYVMSVDDGALLMSVRTEMGWQRMPTGFAIRGDVSAVDLGGLFPTVYLSQDGGLWELWGDEAGWHSRPTGVEVWGAISAIVDADGYPVVFNVRNGFLFRSWQDPTGWHTESTGIEATGRVSATQTAHGPDIVLVEDEAVFRITTDGTTWSVADTGLDAGTSVTTVDLGGAAPLVVQVG